MRNFKLAMRRIFSPCWARAASGHAVGAFLEGLQQSGWTIGQNVRIDSRWATTNPVEIRRHAEDLAALAPDAILTASSPALAALQQVTRTVPIVFVSVIDPVGSGFVICQVREHRTAALPHSPPPRGHGYSMIRVAAGLDGFLI